MDGLFKIDLATIQRGLICGGFQFGLRLAAAASVSAANKVSKVAGEKGNVKIAKLLQSELGAIQMSINDISIGHVRAARDQLDFALTEINTHNQTSSRPQASSDLAPTSSDPLQYLSDTAIEYINSADKNAQLAFSFENVPFTMRIFAIKIKATCLGLKLANQPHRLGELWKKCLDMVLDDAACKRVIAGEEAIREGNFLKKMSLKKIRKPDKWREVSSFCREMLSALNAISPDADYTDGIIEYYKSLSIFNLLSREDIVSSDSNFEIKSHLIIRENKFRIDVDAPSQARCLAHSLVQQYTFERKNSIKNSLTCLPDGSFVVATDKAIIKYSDNFQQLASRPSEWMELIYDPLRESIWGWKNGDHKLIEINSDDLSQTGFKLSFPPSVRLKVSSVNVSITKSGWMMIFCNLAQGEAKVWATNTSDSNPWFDTNLEISGLLEERQGKWLYDIAVIEHTSTQESHIIKVAILAKTVVAIRTLELFKDKVAYDLKPEKIVYEFPCSIERKIDRHICTFNNDGDLIILGDRQRFQIHNYGLGPIDFYSTSESTARYRVDCDDVIVEAQRLWTSEKYRTYCCEDIQVPTSTLYKTDESVTNNFIKAIEY